ncbi:MAG: hypothetical protein WAK85_14050 [Xanthobacteraceae bacterium]
MPIEAMPGYELIEHLEYLSNAFADDDIADRDMLAKPIAEAVSRACRINLFARAIHASERPKIVRRIPGAERQPIDLSLDSAPCCGIDVLFGDR